MAMKRAYYYFFYKFYILFESGTWLTKSKALSVISLLEIWLWFSFFIYYNFIFKKNSDIESSALIVLTVVVVVNSFFFSLNDNWKVYVKQFNELPAKKNKIGTWIVGAVTAFIVANFIFSIYLLSIITKAPIK
jgi:hypothetical protein